MTNPAQPQPSENSEPLSAFPQEWQSLSVVHTKLKEAYCELANKERSPDAQIWAVQLAEQEKRFAEAALTYANPNPQQGE